MTLEVDGVSVAIGTKTIVEEATFKVNDGEIVGLLGPNGCGKSTLLRSIFRALKPQRGQVRLDGEDIWRHTATWVGQRLGVVLQNAALSFPFSVSEVVLLGRTAHKRLLERDSVHDHHLVAAALATVDMEGLADRNFQQLSGGERQRVFIAQALASQPQMFVMDEPMNHLDLLHQHDLMRILKAMGAPALIAMHDLNLAARYCDRICIMRSGRVIAVGTPSEVLTPELVSEVYGVPILVKKHPDTGDPIVVVR